MDYKEDYFYRFPHSNLVFKYNDGEFVVYDIKDESGQPLYVCPDREEFLLSNYGGEPKEVPTHIAVAWKLTRKWLLDPIG